MRIESRRLFGRFAFIRNVVLVFLLIIGADQIFGISIRPVQPPPPPPPTGYLTVTIDAPPNINSAVQWYVSQNGGGSSGWLNNGDTAAMPSGSYTISFRPITGWAVPANQGVSLPAGSTNTFSGSYSFISLSGDYQGLFSEASGLKYESCGFCEISSGKGLSFTAKISTQGKKYSLSGKFDAGGNAWGTISPSDASPLSVHFVSGEDILTGEISNETWTATILAKRNIFAAKSHPASQAGKYTFVLESETNSTGQPGGDSFGTMTIDKSGGVTLAATFSDGAKASQKTILTKDGLWPFYVSLYSGKGFACGWLQLQGTANLIHRRPSSIGNVIILAEAFF